MCRVTWFLLAARVAMICQLIPSENEKRDCATEEEYKTFAATLMEHH